MNLSRRKAMGLLGAIPVVGPAMAAKIQNEAVAGKLMGMDAGGLGYTGQVGAPASIGSAESEESRQLTKKMAMQLPWFREELEKLMRESYKHVGAIDPDLAVLKSVSLSAKIVYQRQRNVEREVRNYGDTQAWIKLDRLWARIPKLFG